MDNITILGRRAKHGGLVSDFDPEESDTIIMELATGIKQALARDVDEIHVRLGERLEKVIVKAKDNSARAEISHVPVDTFGEKHAEVRAVLNIEAKHKPNILDAIHSQHFTATETS